MRKLSTGFLTIVVGLMSCVSSAWAQPPDIMTPCEAIMSAPSRMERWKAFQELASQHGAIRNCLLDNLQQQMQKPDRSWDGPFDLTIAALEQLRVEQAAGPLISLIDFQLDWKTAPAGGYYTADSAYIVANFLKTVGGKNVVDGIFQRLVYPPAEDGVLRASAYVLKEILGRDIIQFMIQKKLERLTTVEYNIAKADTRTEAEAKLQAQQSFERSPEAQNLEKISQLLVDEKKPLLLYPDGKP